MYDQDQIEPGHADVLFNAAAAGRFKSDQKEQLKAKKLFINAKDEPARMFKSDFMEFFSRVHFTTPLIIYVPLISFFTYLTITNPEMSFLGKIGYYALGLFLWTIAEYFIHRYLFHYHPKTELMERIHFLTHGVHHDYPQDSTRLVMPPAVSIPLAFFFYFFFRGVAGAALVNPLFAGFVLGYLIYDMTHFAVHHANWKSSVFRRIKKHHMDHHYRNPDAGFGFTSKLWDKIFGTDFK